MTVYYVDSAGSNTSPYDTKAKAANLLSTILAIDAAGDTIYIADTHTETPTGPITHACAGTLASPSKIICIDFGTDALSTGAVIGSTTTMYITGLFYCYGVTVKSGVGSSTASHNITISASFQKWEECSFYVATTNVSGEVLISNSRIDHIELINCHFHFAATGHQISLAQGRIRIVGGGLITGTSAITRVFACGNTNSIFAEVSGFDASLAASSTNLVRVTANTQVGLLTLSNILMPASWSGVLTDGIPYNSDLQVIGSNISSSGTDANYYSASQSYCGKHVNDTSLYVSTTDGTEHNMTAIKQSHKVTMNVNAEYPSIVFYSLLYTDYNTVTTSQTATIEFIHNESANLTDADIWLELEYLATSGSSKSTLLTDAAASVLATPADQTTSTADWDDGLTARANSFDYSVGNIIKVASNAGRAFICTADTGSSAGSEPAGYATAVDGDSITDGSCTFKAMKRQKLTITFTAAEQGPLLARIAISKASAVVWLSTKLTVA